MQINTIIIEDTGIEAAGIKLYVLENNNVLANFETSQEFFAEHKKYEKDVDVLLIDYDLQKTGSQLNGDEIIKKLTEENYSAKCAIVTNFDDFEHAILAKKAGALGFSAKNINPEQYANFINQLTNTDEFIVEETTKDKIFSHLLMKKHVEVMPENFGLGNKHIEFVKALITGEKTDNILINIFKAELSSKLNKYVRKNKSNFELNSFLVFLENKKKEKMAANNHQKYQIDRISQLLADIKRIINSDIDIIEKYNKIFNLKNASLFFSNQKIAYKKLKDNLLTSIKKKIQSALNLPNTKKETIIASVVAKQLISETEINRLLQIRRVYPRSK